MVRLVRFAIPLLCFLPAWTQSRSFTEVAPGVFKYRDTCNVFALVRNDKALLIDIGTGAVLSHLKELGVERAEWVLHTHFHRDHTAGDPIARSSGVRIAVPEKERQYFEKAQELWQGLKVLHRYDLRNDFLAPVEDIPVDHGLRPGETFDWQDLQIKVLGTPGHTEGSLSFLVTIGGKKLAFVGDLTASAGRVPTVYDLEWDYLGSRGLAAEVNSLNILRQHAPDLTLPSHGAPYADALTSIPVLSSALTQLIDLYNWYTYSVRKPMTGVTKMSPHLWHVRNERNGTSYVLVSDSGHAFIWDANAQDLKEIEEIQKRSGFRRVDAIAVSHYHDDHADGINRVREKYGAPVWAIENMAEVLENPSAFRIPCLPHEPIRVDRRLKDGETVRWEGYTLQFFHMPGQTEYAQALLVEVDGKRLLFQGDNISYPLPGRPIIGHYVCRNFQRLDGGHRYSSAKYITLRPDYLVPNHFEWVPATESNLLSYVETSLRVSQLYKKVSGQPDPMFGIDPNWISAFPYQVQADAGEPITIQIRCRNWLRQPSVIRVEARPPRGWKRPKPLVLTVPAHGEGSAPLQLSIPPDARKDWRYVVTLDVVRDGVPLGEISEFLLNMSPMRAH